MYIEFLQKIGPYVTDNLNTLEFRSSIASFTTFYGGLFFINAGIPVPVTVFMFVAILASNCIFWFSWIKLVFPNFSARAENYFMARVCCCFKRRAKKDFDRIEDESELDRSAAHESNSASFVSGPALRQLNVNSESASTKNIQIADSAKKDLLSKPRTKAKLDRVAKKKSRAAPTTTAVNDASKTIDESRADLD